MVTQDILEQAMAMLRMDVESRSRELEDRVMSAILAPLRQELERSKMELEASRQEVDAGRREHSSLVKRVDFLEKELGAGHQQTDALNRGLTHFNDEHAKEQSLAARGSIDFSLNEELDEERRARRPLLERVGYLEKEVGSSAAKQEQMAKLTRRQGQVHDQHAKELDERRQAHASLEERMAFVEKTMGDSVEKHNQEMDARKQDLGNMTERLASLEKMAADSASKLLTAEENHRRATEQHNRHAKEADDIKKRVEALETEERSLLQKEEELERVVQERSQRTERFIKHIAAFE